MSGRTGGRAESAAVGSPGEQVILLPAGGGRRCEMGLLSAPFKVDEAETEAAYSVSEWILAPGPIGKAKVQNTA